MEADLFIPAGGRPETIDDRNWRQFLLADGRPSSRVIVEGANSFITPEARVNLQQQGVLLLRDASANKCGVISSSYEIIANLLLSEKEFLKHKQEYVRDVLEILVRRASDEANLIMARHAPQHPALPQAGGPTDAQIPVRHSRRGDRLLDGLSPHPAPDRPQPPG